MRAKNIAPDIFSYNLLLRTIKDCNIGDLSDASKVILGSSAVAENPDKESTSRQDIEESGKSSSTAPATVSNKLVGNELEVSDIPDVLAPVPISSAVFELKEMAAPEDR